MDAGYIFISSLVFSAKASSVYAVYWFAKFLPVRSERGYIPWGAPVSLGEKLSAYGRCFVVALLIAGFAGGVIEGRKHDLDDTAVTFLVVFVAACLGASTGLQQERKPPVPPPVVDK